MSIVRWAFVSKASHAAAVRGRATGRALLASEAGGPGSGALTVVAATSPPRQRIHARHWSLRSGALRRSRDLPRS
ncbi:hypothetical protein AKJ09_02324 [Labilithrix luteola]|uniref:Uncharacterized protein n=1 Tax=Labilithrix luteola TaxID=1391654 RepID=A0A0K1PQ37_9BACT|nr:hypothetical protein AKJ09_02324 [Labilithrix luteola]